MAIEQFILESSRQSRSERDLTRNLLLEDALRDRPRRTEVAQTEEKTIKWRGQDITLRSLGGKNVYFKDGASEWESKDGTTWIKKGTDGHVSWRGTIRIDDKDNLIEEGTAFGITRTRSPDGKSIRSITTATGQEVSITTFANGRQEFKGQSIWRSADGNTWTGTSGTWSGKLQLDENGLLWRKSNDATSSWEIPYRSAESQRIQDRMQELRTKYNVSFGAAGKEMDYQDQDPETDKYVTLKITLRLPAMAELETMEKCLEKYAHLAPKTDQGRDFNGLRFSFIDSSGDGKKVGLWGWYNSNREGIPQVFFGPGNSRLTTGWEALEGTALHEIAHHLQYQRWTGPGGKEVPAGIRDFFGWQKNGTGGYWLRDKDGKLWERDQVRLKDPATNKWYYTGRWFPVEDNTVVKDLAKARTNQQLFDKLPDERKPCTKYFTHPQEAHAEAIAMLMHNPGLLWDRNKKLYEETRKWDQADITNRFGTQKKDGKDVPKMMRGVDGKIVPNNAENRTKVQQMEQRWKRTPKDSIANIDWHESSRPVCTCCI